MRENTGQMIINMKTTITTYGGHNGVIVQSGLQAGTSGLNPSIRSIAPSRFPHIETPGGTLEATYPDRIGLNTSLEEISTSCAQLSSPLKLNIPTSQILSPPSPVFSFTGRNSPPEEFILPSNINLNVFNRRDLAPNEALQQIEQKNEAVINDTVTTTTTVEVFRTPVTSTDQLVALPPISVPGIGDRPQLLRINGPSYEKWSTSRMETLINDPLISSNNQHGKVVQWKEKLVDSNHLVNTNTNSRQLNVPPVVKHRMSPYAVHSPSKSEGVTNSRENLWSSYQSTPTENFIDSSLSYHIRKHSNSQNFTSPVVTAKQNYRRHSFKDQECETSSLENRSQRIMPASDYLIPDKRVTTLACTNHSDHDQELHRCSRSNYGSKNKRYDWSVGYNRIDGRHINHQTNSSDANCNENYQDSEKRQRYEVQSEHHRSESPNNRSQAVNTDIACLTSSILPLENREIFNLYETRDAFQNVIDKL